MTVTLCGTCQWRNRPDANCQDFGGDFGKTTKQTLDDLTTEM